ASVSYPLLIIRRFRYFPDLQLGDASLLVYDLFMKDQSNSMARLSGSTLHCAAPCAFYVYLWSYIPYMMHIIPWITAQAITVLPTPPRTRMLAMTLHAIIVGTRASLRRAHFRRVLCRISSIPSSRPVWC